MSKTKVQLTERQKQRIYVLNVARQFLQSLGKDSPINNKQAFLKAQGIGGSDGIVNSFFHCYRLDIRIFFKKKQSFSPKKLSEIAWAGLGYDEDSKYPVKSCLSRTLGRDPVWWGFGSGPEMTVELALISLAAAAFDLCYAKHHLSGMNPL